MLMMCVTIVIVKMTVFKHEDLLIDLREANKGKLYKGNQLIFIGDGYKAITMMMRNCTRLFVSKVMQKLAFTFRLVMTLIQWNAKRAQHRQTTPKTL